MPPGTPLSVRVSRNGNSRTLSIPAAIAEQERIDAGETFFVEVRPDGLFYRRADAQPGWRIVGEGRDQYVIVDAAAISTVGPDPSPRPPRDWDY